mgnify:CR=1 FL=1
MRMREEEKVKWINLLAAEKVSELSAKDFCKERGLKLSQLRYYQNRHRQGKLVVSGVISGKLAEVKIKTKAHISQTGNEVRIIVSDRRTAWFRWINYCG